MVVDGHAVYQRVRVVVAVDVVGIVVKHPHSIIRHHKRRIEFLEINAVGKARDVRPGNLFFDAVVHLSPEGLELLARRQPLVFAAELLHEDLVHNRMQQYTRGIAHINGVVVKCRVVVYKRAHVQCAVHRIYNGAQVVLQLSLTQFVQEDHPALRLYDQVGVLGAQVHLTGVILVEFYANGRDATLGDDFIGQPQPHQFATGVEGFSGPLFAFEMLDGFKGE